jgi:hypothetical protein
LGGAQERGDDPWDRRSADPDAFDGLWPKARAGYLLSALERLDMPHMPYTELSAL